MVHFFIAHRRREAQNVLAVKFLCDAREGRVEIIRPTQLEISPASFLGELPEVSLWPTSNQPLS